MRDVDRGDDARFRKISAYRMPQRWKIDTFGGHWHYHRPMEDYVSCLAGAGFVVTRLAEPPSLPHSRTPEREWTAHERWFVDIPTMLAILARPDCAATTISKWCGFTVRLYRQ